jgi:hypothetical protein
MRHIGGWKSTHLWLQPELPSSTAECPFQELGEGAGYLLAVARIRKALVPAIEEGVPAVLLPAGVHEDVIAILDIAQGIQMGWAVAVVILVEDGDSGADDPRQGEDAEGRVGRWFEEVRAIAVQVEGAQIRIQSPALPLLEGFNLLGRGGAGGGSDAGRAVRAGCSASWT